MHRDIIFDHIFYTVTHLGQIIGFDPFSGTLKGQKWSNNAYFSY